MPSITVDVDVSLEEFDDDDLIKELKSRGYNYILIEKNELEALYNLTRKWFTQEPDISVANDAIGQAHDICRNTLGRAV